MKNLLIISAFLFSFTTIYFLSGCSKPGESNVYFYTTTDTTTGPLYLYINGNYEGQLTENATKLSCSTDDLTSKTISKLLKEDYYNLAAKDSLGNMVSYASFKFTNRKRSSSLSSSGNLGLQEIASVNDCILIYMHK
jgi:hypothetical protein